MKLDKQEMRKALNKRAIVITKCRKICQAKWSNFVLSLLPQSKTTLSPQVSATYGTRYIPKRAVPVG